MDPITAAKLALEAYLLLRNLGYKEEDLSSLRRVIISQIMDKIGGHQTLRALNMLAVCDEFSKEKRRIFEGDRTQVRHSIIRKRERRKDTGRKYSGKIGAGRKTKKRQGLADRLMRGY